MKAPNDKTNRLDWQPVVEAERRWRRHWLFFLTLASLLTVQVCAIVLPMPGLRSDQTSILLITAICSLGAASTAARYRNRVARRMGALRVYKLPLSVKTEDERLCISSGPHTRLLLKEEIKAVHYLYIDSESGCPPIGYQNTILIQSQPTLRVPESAELLHSLAELGVEFRRTRL